jgi:hypothetical protein
MPVGSGYSHCKFDKESRRTAAKRNSRALETRTGGGLEAMVRTCGLRFELSTLHGNGDGAGLVQGAGDNQTEPELLSAVSAERPDVRVVYVFQWEAENEPT